MPEERLIGVSEYLTELERWLFVTIQLGIYPVDYSAAEIRANEAAREEGLPIPYTYATAKTVAQKIMERIKDPVAFTSADLASLPWYSEITSGMDPSVFFQKFAPSYEKPATAEIPYTPQIPPERAGPAAGEYKSAFLEEMRQAPISPAMKSFFQARYPGMLAEFQESPEWQRKIRATKSKLEFLGYPTRIQGVRVPKEQAGKMPFYERIYPEKGEMDVFGEYLKQYPYRERFLKAPPRERGYYPSRYAPPARWLPY